MHMSHQNVLDNQKGQTLDEDSLTSYQVWAIQQRCVIICLALTIVKEKMSGFFGRNIVSWQFNMQVQQESSFSLSLELSWSGIAAFVQSRNLLYHKEKKITYIHSCRQIKMFLGHATVL
jgi:hypothetical protein